MFLLRNVCTSSSRNKLNPASDRLSVISLLATFPHRTCGAIPAISPPLGRHGRWPWNERPPLQELRRSASSQPVHPGAPELHMHRSVLWGESFSMRFTMLLTTAHPPQAGGCALLKKIPAPRVNADEGPKEQSERVGFRRVVSSGRPELCGLLFYAMLMFPLHLMCSDNATPLTIEAIQIIGLGIVLFGPVVLKKWLMIRRSKQLTLRWSKNDAFVSSSL